jgi:hypothetical protein
MSTIAMALLAALADEAGLRAAVEKADVSGKAAAVAALKGAKEEKSLLVLAGALKDPSKEVRKAAAAALGETPDPKGASLPALRERLLEKSEEPGLRLLCAKAIARSPYREAPIRALLDCMAGISNQDKHLHEFGAEVAGILDRLAGKSFGADKLTVEKWENWFTDNLERLKAEDAIVRRKAGAGK